VAHTDITLSVVWPQRLLDARLWVTRPGREGPRGPPGEISGSIRGKLLAFGGLVPHVRAGPGTDGGDKARRY